MSKIITIFGATGNQGGSVIKAILSDPALSKDFRLRGITRDVSKPAAQILQKQGIELKSADMNSKTSVAEAIIGSHTVFLVTNFWESGDGETELAQGKNVADAAKEAGVQHLIFSSLLPVAELTGGRLKHVPHFDKKAEIERYIRSTGVPLTAVLPGYYMSNYEQALLRKGEDGVYTLAYPVGGKAQFPLIDAAEDMGKFVLAAIKNRSKLQNAQVLAAADYYTPERIISEFQAVTGKQARFVQLDADTFKSFLPPAVADAMLESHLFIEDPGYYAGKSLDESLALIAESGLKPTSWVEYLEKNKGAFN